MKTIILDDLNNDGVITESEVNSNNIIIKTVAQTNLAYIASIAMIVATVFLFLPIIPDTRISALSDLLTLFYLSQASIVGTYMGVQAWMNKK